MGAQAIMAGIFGTIIVVLAFILYPPLVNGMALTVHGDYDFVLPMWAGYIGLEFTA